MATLSKYDGILTQKSDGIFNVLFSTEENADRYLEETLQPTAVLEILQEG
jgi:hypothetical protein